MTAEHNWAAIVEAGGFSPGDSFTEQGPFFARGRSDQKMHGASFPVAAVALGRRRTMFR